MPKKKGFTIIELLVVMAVIAILIGIAIPSFRGMQMEAWRTQAEGDLRVLKIALESYYKTNGSFPPAGGNYQDTLMNEPTRILESTLNDPFKSPAGVYGYDLNGSFYVVFSVGVYGNGSATIGLTGEVTKQNSPIYATNGY
jgi:prepilin-type N-terminal cleavage/methylation domain-containing protein